ncbi:PA0069 family radical SAM protein [Leptospira sp. 'Mane']|uniref:PA0069 family radical SAM protein n=1 Tax=Leptospira sp. 'Mane' TaxID=3387407 RepID=UPI00398A94BC
MDTWEKKPEKSKSRRGTLSSVPGRFTTVLREDWEEDKSWNETDSPTKTEFFSEYPKTLITSNDSPDIPHGSSINPYRGCEHGCIYCFARPNHSYVDLSPGIDFESKIFIKHNVAGVLVEDLKRKKGEIEPILLGTATDPYQPIERKMENTRKILQICLEFRQPVEIITKSLLVLRDLDILSEMAKLNLIRVCVSVTTMNKELWSKLEPRTASPNKRMEAISGLSSIGVPVILMFAPVIPFLNDHEMESIVHLGKQNGISFAVMILVRLPYEVAPLFEDWLTEHYPLKKDKVLGLIRDTREGKLYQSDFKQRMTGTGNYAELLRARFRLVRKQAGLIQGPKVLETGLFRIPEKFQIRKGKGEETLPGLF